MAQSSGSFYPLGVGNDRGHVAGGLSSSDFGERLSHSGLIEYLLLRARRQLAEVLKITVHLVDWRDAQEQTQKMQDATVEHQNWQIWVTRSEYQ